MNQPAMPTPNYDRLAIVSRTMEERGVGADSLCSRCRNGMVFRRRGHLHITVRCGGMTVPSDLVECSSFMDRKSLSLYEMQVLACDIDARIGVQDGAYR